MYNVINVEDGIMVYSKRFNSYDEAFAFMKNDFMDAFGEGDYEANYYFPSLAFGPKNDAWINCEGLNVSWHILDVSQDK